MRLRPKRPILRAMLAAQNPATRTRPLALTSGKRGPHGEVCWFTQGPDYAQCCSYPGHALPFCVTYPDVD